MTRSWTLIANLLLMMLASPIVPALADQTVKCTVVDDLAEVTHADTIAVTRSQAGKECRFTTSLKAGTKRDNEGSARSIGEMMRADMRALANQGLAMDGDDGLRALARLLTASFFEFEFDEESINRLADQINNQRDLFGHCLGSAPLGERPTLALNDLAACGFVEPENEAVAIGAFDLAVQASEPVLVIYFATDETVYALFIPQSALMRALAIS